MVLIASFHGHCLSFTFLQRREILNFKKYFVAGFSNTLKDDNMLFTDNPNTFEELCLNTVHLWTRLRHLNYIQAYSK